MVAISFMINLAMICAGLAFIFVIPLYILLFIYTTPYLLWSAFEIHKRFLPTTYRSDEGVFKLLGRTTKFYFQILCFKKPTL